MFVLDAIQLLVAQAKVDTNVTPVFSDLKRDGQQVGFCQIPTLRVTQIQRRMLELIQNVSVVRVQSLQQEHKKQN